MGQSLDVLGNGHAHGFGVQVITDVGIRLGKSQALTGLLILPVTPCKLPYIYSSHSGTGPFVWLAPVRISPVKSCR
jgi:hypothetical protein